jgi:hypothetical protein
METELTETAVVPPAIRVSVNKDAATAVLAPVADNGSEKPMFSLWYPLS